MCPLTLDSSIRPVQSGSYILSSSASSRNAEVNPRAKKMIRTTIGTTRPMISFHLGELRATCEDEGDAAVAVVDAEIGKFNGDELPVQTGTTPGATVDA